MFPSGATEKIPTDTTQNRSRDLFTVVPSINYDITTIETVVLASQQ